MTDQLNLVRPFADDEHFAVREWAWLSARPAVTGDLDTALVLLADFAGSDSAFLRRFACEVIRPRGVWSTHIPDLKLDPSRALPILELVVADIEPRTPAERRMLHRSTEATGVLELAQDVGRAVRQRSDHEWIATVTDADARTLIECAIAPNLQAVAERLLGDLESTAAIATMLSGLQERLAVHMRRPADLANHLNGPWASAHMAAYLASAADSLRAARVSEMLVELAARSPVRSGRQPDRIDIGLLEVCAAAALETALDRQANMAQIAGLHVQISPGSTRFDSSAAGLVDLRGFQQMLSLVQAASVKTAMDVPLEAGENDFVRLSREGDVTVMGPWRHLDTALRDLSGAGMDELVAVLATAADLPHDRAGFARTTRAALSQDASNWADLDLSAVQAACDLLTLNPGALTREPYEYWKLEARPLRLATRPFLLVDDELWLSPARARGTQNLFANYLSEGRVPWPRNPRALAPGIRPTVDDDAETEIRWTQVQEAARRLRQIGNRRLEVAVTDRIREAGWPARGSVKPNTKGAPAATLYDGSLPPFVRQWSRRLFSAPCGCPLARSTSRASAVMSSPGPHRRRTPTRGHSCCRTATSRGHARRSHRRSVRRRSSG